MDPLTEPARRNLVTARLRLRSWRDEDESPMLHAFVVRHRSLLAAEGPAL